MIVFKSGVSGGIPWPEKRAARLKAALARDQRRAELAAAKKAERPKDLRLTIVLIERFLASTNAEPCWKRKMERHLLFWRSFLGRRTLRNLSRSAISEALNSQPNQKERFDVLKSFFVFLEESGLMDPVESGISGLAIDDVLFESVEKKFPEISRCKKEEVPERAGREFDGKLPLSKVPISALLVNDPKLL